MNNSTFFEYKIQNTIASIDERLKLHRMRGTKSNLSIFEAAHLMDLKVSGNFEVDPNVLRISLT